MGQEQVAKEHNWTSLKLITRNHAEQDDAPFRESSTWQEEPPWEHVTRFRRVVTSGCNHVGKIFCLTLHGGHVHVSFH